LAYFASTIIFLTEAVWGAVFAAAGAEPMEPLAKPAAGNASSKVTKKKSNRFIMAIHPLKEA
jgi:hypothetical protein